MGVITKSLGKKSDPPPSPNFTQVAQAQGDANLNTARVQTQLNRPNEITPFGSRTWQQNGDQYTSTETMSPEIQALWDKTSGNAANTLNGDFGSHRDAIVDALYNRSTRLMDPQWQQTEEQRKADLINSGFSVGDEGYTREMGNLQRSKGEAYAGARDTAMSTGMQQALAERMGSLNEMNAVRMPQFQPYSATSGISPAPLFPAAQAQWGASMDQSNFQQAQNAGMMSGLFGLGSAYLGSNRPLPGFMS